MTLTKTKIKPRQSTFQNKHKKNELHYFWPYIPLIALIIVGYSVIKIIHFSQIITTNQSVTTQSLLNQINQIRQKNHLPQLQTTNQLNQLAKNINHLLISNHENLNDITSSKQVNISWGLSQVPLIIQSWKSSNHQALFQASTKQIGLNINQVNHQYLISAIGASNQNIHITFRVNSKPQSSSKTKPISIIYDLTNGFIANTYLIVMIGLLVIIFVFRHFLLIKKTIQQSEKLIIKHLWLDFTIILLIIVAFLLMQNIGFIL